MSLISENRRKWPKNDQKWPKSTKLASNWPPKWPKMTKNGKIGLKDAIFCHFRNSQFWKTWGSENPESGHFQNLESLH